MMPTETTIILAIVGMIGLFATATIYQRANRITSRYYATKSRISNRLGTTTAEEVEGES
jgi:xanthosine utilization system XapX-like protein